MKLVVGLGNPGFVYARNRHNIGFMCLRHLARKLSISLDTKQAGARVGEGEVDGIRLVLARPQTMMNLSGQSVSRLLNKYHINLEEMTVIHDDLDLPVGKIRLRQDGRSGGHRGIESIIAHLGSADFVRVRVGIGRPDLEGTNQDKEAEIVDYVLSDFTTEEEKIIAQVIPEVSEAIICLLNEGLTAAMNRFN
jgi:PTH1 family peptidyl-tRNA hydrolase